MSSRCPNCSTAAESKMRPSSPRPGSRWLSPSRDWSRGGQRLSSLNPHLCICWCIIWILGPWTSRGRKMQYIFTAAKTKRLNVKGAFSVFAKSSRRFVASSNCHSVSLSSDILKSHLLGTFCLYLVVNGNFFRCFCVKTPQTDCCLHASPLWLHLGPSSFYPSPATPLSIYK